MINYFYNDYSDDYENFYFGEKRNNLNYFGEDNELDNPIPNDEYRDDKHLLYDSGLSGLEFPPSLFKNNSNSNTGNNTEPTSENKQNELLNQKRKREEIIIKKEKKQK